ncbi:hypothetical protein CRU86_05700 [Aliarcobacter skirrowii]|jgi:hypothetical protein|uniref:Tetratricopeptide repeat protein n=2 Tax=Aliarcobacter skirrowii TaxID=28200 RepID=A0AAD0WPC5_9BACT|nr:hypothetical protein [Aliarcobacter skirrowii]AXX85586.1 hypothetical protein ASKIR_1819 [Aliarcobacter skirrowii CCUG 10374]AZL54648.1 hypothetical protein EI285_08715 [Aliarcobacter skirrowii]KAB0621005.1 hypothetical protein F7P70_04475 [Aliarcobacter skirrowii CCUG 10374]MDD2508323.1 hypothetical protein [Aliarcobacter skirrowii]MDD3496611.1 hypothetical protein [Aliarcobacter skirrowii]
MSIKDDVNYLKNELNNEEKLLENFVKLERFFKKYKKIIYVLILLAIITPIAIFTKNKIDQSNLYKANIALNNYLEQGDESSLEYLKNKNQSLYEVALFLTAKKELSEINISSKYLKELLEYQIAAKEMNFDKLDALRKNDDFLIKDYAILHEAIILVNQEEYEKAKAILEEINQDSKVYELAILLKHNLVTK